MPLAGVSTLSAIKEAAKSPSYLQDEIKSRVASGPIGFSIKAQLAIESDITDDATIRWADSNPVVELGTLEVNKLVEDSDVVAKTTIFDPLPRVKGVEPSDDPLLEMRAALYLISGKQRRAA